jgi:hypothetical protein
VPAHPWGLVETPACPRPWAKCPEHQRTVSTGDIADKFECRTCLPDSLNQYSGQSTSVQLRFSSPALGELRQQSPHWTTPSDGEC